MSYLTNKVYTNEHRDFLSSPDVKNTLDNIHKDFVFFLVDKATGSVSLVCKRFYASVITRELGLNYNSPTGTYSNAGGVDKNIGDLKIKFGIDNILLKIIDCLICTGCLRCIKALLKLDSL